MYIQRRLSPPLILSKNSDSVRADGTSRARTLTEMSRMCAAPTPPAAPAGSESTEITAWPTTSLSVTSGYVPGPNGSVAPPCDCEEKRVR